MRRGCAPERRSSPPSRISARVPMRSARSTFSGRAGATGSRDPNCRPSGAIPRAVGDTWTPCGGVRTGAVVVEVDGALHRSLRRWYADQLRQNEISSTGALVLRFPSVIVRCEPDPVAAQLRRALGRANARSPSLLLVLRPFRRLACGARRGGFGMTVWPIMTSAKSASAPSSCWVIRSSDSRSARRTVRDNSSRSGRSLTNPRSLSIPCSIEPDSAPVLLRTLSSTD